MLNIEKTLQTKPFLEKNKKNIENFSRNMNQLTRYHYKKCKEYKRILDFLKYKYNKDYSLEELPFIPVRLFKKYNLISSNNKNIVKTLMSSGTTGSKTSRIHLDKENSKSQITVLTKIVSSIIGKNRLPMLIIDSPSTIQRNQPLSARSAAILGFAIFGSNITYALNTDLSINLRKISEFYEKYKNQKFLIFGFTSMIWQKFCLDNKLKNEMFNLKNGIVLHGGGWKKLENQKVSNFKFKEILEKNYKLKKIYNYYGMVEQTGSIFFECEKCGYFITSAFSDIIIRDNNFKILQNGKKGLVQLISILPTSYPGQNIITEDLGMISESKNCTCSKFGKRFKIFGRIKEAELRGCSNI